MIRFGTGGWRAIIGEDFIKSNIELLSKALAMFIHETLKEGDKAKIVIGYDRRFLSRKASIWCAQVLSSYGVKVLFIDEIAPTPLVMSAVGKYETTFGMMITASHNPGDYNGIKIFTRGGMDARKEETDRIEEIIDEISGKEIAALDYRDALDSGTIMLIDPFNEYIDDILKSLDVESIKKRRLRVLLDPMHGVSRTCLQTVLMSARCEVDVINDRTDPLFGGKLPAPSGDTLRKLKDMVAEGQYDIGLATDGDADRLGIVDETGRFIHPNEILILLYYYLLEYKKCTGAVVRNIATTHLLDLIARDHGEKCIEVPVGFKNISEGMEENCALIGGESSGGLTIRGHIKGKDGIFAAGLIIELMSVTGKTLSGLLQEVYDKYGRAVMVEKNYSFRPSDKARIEKKLFEEKQLPDYSFDIDRVSYRDGLKIYFKNGGWIIARFSGTEPMLRIFAEMENESMSLKTIESMEKMLAS